MAALKQKKSGLERWWTWPTAWPGYARNLTGKRTRPDMIASALVAQAQPKAANQLAEQLQVFTSHAVC